MEVITSKENSNIKHARALLDKKHRIETGHFLLEGKKFVSDAITSGYKIEKLFVDSAAGNKFDSIIASVDAPVFFVEPNVFKSLCDTQTPQGIIAELALPFLGAYKYKKGDRLLVLDRISDPGNMGTIIRSAKATGFEYIFAIDCVDVYSPKVVRSSAGAVLSANIYPVEEKAIISYCAKHNITLLVADMYGENIYDLNLDGDYAVVIGNEGHGVSDSFVSSGKLIKLPMKPGIESLNAGVSASVIMYILEGKNI